MALLNVLTWGDQRLRRKSREVRVEELTDDFRKWCQDLTESMYEYDGIGLAAPQVGVDLRVMVVDTEYPETGVHVPVLYVNPVIRAVGPMCDIEEGCLSVPGVRGKVTRPEIIDIEWMDAFGVAHVREGVGGLTARCLQHEMDHLEGVLFVDHLSAGARSLVQGKLRRLARNQEA